MSSAGLIDDARIALDHGIQIGQPIQRLGGTQHQITAGAQGGMNAPQYVLLHIGREVDEDIAAEHDIEAPQDAVAVQQIELAKLEPIANGWLDGPLPGLGRSEEHTS